jgi:hypothetical protein
VAGVRCTARRNNSNICQGSANYFPLLYTHRYSSKDRHVSEFFKSCHWSVQGCCELGVLFWMFTYLNKARPGNSGPKFYCVGSSSKVFLNNLPKDARCSDCQWKTTECLSCPRPITASCYAICVKAARCQLTNSLFPLAGLYNHAPINASRDYVWLLKRMNF